MKTNVSIMRQIISIIDGLNIDSDVVSIEIAEHCTKIYDVPHYYRAAHITLRNGDMIFVRDDSSFDATDKEHHSKPLLSVGK